MSKRIRLLDPLIDPPVARSTQDRRELAASQVKGTLGGAIAGTAIGLALSRNKDPIDRFTGTLGSMGIGLGVGSVIGQYGGNRKVLKRRLANNEPLHTPAEEALKLKHYGLNYPLRGYKEPLPGAKVEHNPSATYQALRTP